MKDIPSVIIGLIFGILLAAVSIHVFVRPVVSDKEIRQEKLNVQRRCEDEFAMFPREHGKALQEGIKKCRNVAGFKTVGGTKR